jgi:hypothetical protein
MSILFSVDSLFYEFVLVYALCTYVYELDGSVIALAYPSLLSCYVVVACCH